MKKHLFGLVLAIFGSIPALPAQWLNANFKSAQETILPAEAFVAGKDAGNRPYYITKIEMDGVAYITKIGKGWTGVTVPRGNTTANVGVSGAANNPFLVYCGDVKWVSAINGGTPANPVVVPTPTFGDVWIARVSLNSNTSGIGWVPVGQSEAQYLDQGVIHRTNRYHLLTHAGTPPPVAVVPQPEQAPNNNGEQVAPPATRQANANKKPGVVVAPGSSNSGGNTAQGNMKTGGVTFVFVYENGKIASGEDTYVEVIVQNKANLLVIGQYRLSSAEGELPLNGLEPGTYSAMITANYQENTSGNREGWTTSIPLTATPNPYVFTIRGGMVAMERVVLKK